MEQVSGQKRQFELEPNMPSHLPAPDAAPPPPTDTATVRPAGTGGRHPAAAAGPLPPPPAPPPPPPFVPFGLNHVILILVPQFKTKFRQLPQWIHSNVKVAMPITIFFDKLDVPPGMFLPPFARPPFVNPAGPIPPPGLYNYPYPFGEMADADPETEALEEGEGFKHYDEDDETYEHEHVYDEGEYRSAAKRRRRKRHSSTFKMPPPEPDTVPVYPDVHPRVAPKIRKKRAVAFNETVHSTERASLLPKLENLLDSAGLGGKACLLRTICEVHEAPLEHYGLMGQLITMFFSVSRSMFAESHLPEYLEAERVGLTGNCSKYTRDCSKTMFSWEETSTSRYNDIFEG